MNITGNLYSLTFQFVIELLHELHEMLCLTNTTVSTVDRNVFLILVTCSCR